jgi:CheY-like chemotaxis protein
MKGSTCVVVVDDDRDDVFFLRRGFRRAGLRVDLVDVSDGVQVTGYLRGISPYEDRAKFPFPDLIVLDLKMPKMSGFEVLTWLRARPDMMDLPVVVLTSSPLEEDRKMAARLGAHEFLTKPNDCSDWVKLAEYLYKKWLAVDHQPG